MIHIHPFAGLPQLSRLSLTRNPRLARLGPGLVTTTGPGLSVNLSQCAVAGLGEDTLPWARVTQLDLALNPLDCSCQLAWLGNTQLTTQLLLSNATCSSPPAVAGSQLHTQLAELGTRCHSWPELDTWHVAVLGTVATCCPLLLLGAWLLYRGWRGKTAGVRDLAPPPCLLHWERPAPAKPYYDPEYMLDPHQIPGLYSTLARPRPAPGPALPPLNKPRTKAKPPGKLWRALASSPSLKQPSLELEGVYSLDPVQGNIYTAHPGPGPGSSLPLLSYSHSPPDIVYFDLLRGVGAQN